MLERFMKHKRTLILGTVFVIAYMTFLFVFIINKDNKDTTLATSSNADILATESDYNGDIKKAQGLDESLLETNEKGDIVAEAEEILIDEEFWSNITSSDGTSQSELVGGEAALDETIAYDVESGYYTDDNLSDEELERAFVNEQNSYNEELKSYDSENASAYETVHFNEAELPEQSSTESYDGLTQEEIHQQLDAAMRYQAEMGMREKANSGN